MNLIYFLLFFAGGLVVVRYSKWLVDHTTRIDFIEMHFGSTGTYTFVKLVGTAFMLFSFYILLYGPPF